MITLKFGLVGSEITLIRPNQPVKIVPESIKNSRRLTGGKLVEDITDVKQVFSLYWIGLEEASFNALKTETERLTTLNFINEAGSSYSVKVRQFGYGSVTEAYAEDLRLYNDITLVLVEE